jgi:hypothetical protein
VKAAANPVTTVVVPAGQKGPVCGRCKQPLKGLGVARALGIIGLTCDPCCREIRREIDQIIQTAIAEGRHRVP